MHKIKFYIFLLLLVSVPAVCQEKQVLTILDSATIKVGSQANLTLKTFVEEGTKVVFPKDKMFGQLEVLESYPIDTIENGDRYMLIKKYGLTQFDSGRYVIPPLKVTINGQIHQTDSMALEVANVAVDTTRQKMFDIKPVASLESESNIWWYLLILLGFALIGAGIYWDIKRRRQKAKPEIYISPIDRAIGSLKRLDHKQLLQKGEVKEYYSELANIARTYIEEEIKIPAMESTTEGALELLRKAVITKRITLPAETFLQLENMLKNADMVKFAMARPQNDQINDDRTITEQVIKTIQNSIPELTEEEIKQSDAYKEEQLKKQLRRRRITIIAACCTLVIGTMAYFGIMKIYGSLQENVIGYSTEELWSGEWVKSEYGNPAITINTPKVLKRTPFESQMPKEALGKLQEVQIFVYGAPFSKLRVSIGTMKFAPGIQANIDFEIESTIKMWEEQGAKNITITTERFVNEDKLEGIRAYGNLSFPGLERSYFEIIFFQQMQGLQQIVIMHEDQDEYGIKIAEKIKKSVQFRKAL